MGIAAKLAAKHGITICDACKNPFLDERRLSYFTDRPLPRAVCQWCDIVEARRRSEDMARRRREYLMKNPRGLWL